MRNAPSNRSVRHWLAEDEVRWEPPSRPLSEHAARWRAQHARDLSRARARRRRAGTLLAFPLLMLLALAAGVQAAGVLSDDEASSGATSADVVAGERAGDGRAGEAVPAELREIARCESRLDPSAVSADGVYRGKYQFDRTTWAELGGVGDPAAAPERVQDRLATRLYRRRGGNPWPVCGA